MSDAVDVQILGDEELRAKLHEMARRARNYEPALRRFGDTLRAANAARFAAEGPGWAPLSPDYATWKFKHYGPKGILVREGDLLADLTGDPMGIETVTATTGEWGTDIRYARFHQDGTRYMPQRKVLAESPLMETELARLVGEHITLDVV